MTDKRVDWPEDELLAELVWTATFDKIGEVYGCTDRAVAQRCEQRNIPTPPKTYWQTHRSSGAVGAMVLHGVRPGMSRGAISAAASAADMTVAGARERLLSRLQSGAAAICPCCANQCKVYERRLTDTMLTILRLMAAEPKPDESEYGAAVNVPDLCQRHGKPKLALGGDWNRMRHWGLIEMADMASLKTGQVCYRVTPLGFAFLAGEASVPEHIRTYAEQVAGKATARVRLIDGVVARVEGRDG